MSYASLRGGTTLVPLPGTVAPIAAPGAHVASTIQVSTDPNTIIATYQGSTPVHQVVTIQTDVSQANAAAAKAAQAYQSALAALNPPWSKLLLGPYPPASDTSNFPRTGDPSLVVSASQVNAAQLAEPGKVTRGLAQQAQARRPDISPLFWIGLACLGGYLYLR